MIQVSRCVRIKKTCLKQDHSFLVGFNQSEFYPFLNLVCFFKTLFL